MCIRDRRETMERLQKAIAASGLTSRRKAEDLIRQGRVKVNGEVVSELGFKVKQGALILVDDKALEGENKVYYVFYKPKECLSLIHILLVFIKIIIIKK